MLKRRQKKLSKKKVKREKEVKLVRLKINSKIHPRKVNPQIKKLKSKMPKQTRSLEENKIRKKLNLIENFNI